MKTKNYPPHEDKPTITAEPVLTYGNMATSCVSLYQPIPYEMELIMKSKEEFQQGLFYTQEEVDKMVEEWLS